MEKEAYYVGEQINFRGMVYGPINEQGVVFLFGQVADDLDFKVESIQTPFPDCTAIVKLNEGKYKRVNIEFEFESKNFLNHEHDPNKCDIIICWKHNWADYPKDKLQIIALNETVKELSKIDLAEEQDITKASIETSSSNEITQKQKEIDYFYRTHDIPQEIRTLFVNFNGALENKFNGTLQSKIASSCISYSYRNKVIFIVYLQKQKIKIESKVKGEKFPEMVRTEQNWPYYSIKPSDSDLSYLMRIIESAKKNYEKLVAEFCG